LSFGDAELHSSFFSCNGNRFLLKASNGASARLGFLHDLVTDNQRMLSSGAVVFHPEGLFEIFSPAIKKETSGSNLNIFSRDLIVGVAPTEFFDLSGVTHIEFVKRKPAFFREDENAIPSPVDRGLIEDRGKVFTSYMRFRVGSATLATPYYSQPAETPLFEYSGGEADHLRRLRSPYFSADIPMPAFPHAGFRPAASTGSEPEILQFESTHLAQYRRNRRPAHEFRETLIAKDAPVVNLAVTPQGLLAEVTDGQYSKLYFGNPDTIKLRNEFALNIINPGQAGSSDAKHLYLEVQQALAGSQLFMVFQNPKPEALKVVRPSAELYARKFSFSVCPDTGNLMKASVLIVKYFKGQSLATLVGKSELWACQDSLAFAKDSKEIERLTHLGGDVNKPVPEPLKSIWADPNWQGVLILDFPIIAMPDVVEALRPGINGDLRAHHFGLNALSAKRGDLSKLNVVTQRQGSVFGLIQYSHAADPTPPDTNDHEPGPGGTPVPDPGRRYAFVVDSLQIAFANSQISTFQAKVFVKFSHLFWDSLATGPGGMNSLELDGYYERRPIPPSPGRPNGDSEDVFSLVSPTEFSITFSGNSYLRELKVKRAQLSVISLTRDEEKLTKLKAFIGFDGVLTLGETLQKLPLFKVKAIRLSAFGFEFDYQPGKLPFKFGFKADSISADINFEPESVGAPPSLLSLLPVKLKGMSIAIGKLLDLADLNFQPLPFDLGGLGSTFHFGFLMELDLGSLGQLAGDLRGLRVPLLLGWGGGQSQGLAFGIQFPSLNAKIDIGIQQFIRLQADRLKVQRCLDGAENLTAVAIQAINARVVMLGKAWPDTNCAFVIFIPVRSNRKPSWALGLDNGNWYVGGGYRIHVEGTETRTTKAVVDAFEATLNDLKPSLDVCRFIDRQLDRPDEENWSIAARYKGSFNAAVAISDPDVYGLYLEILGLGGLDVLYRRVNGQLGIFSVECTLPGPAKTIQMGAATIRLPVFRLEVHTDGGFLADFGFPWNNDFSRSCQVEMAIFLGSGGFYYGRTSAAASELLSFEGGYDGYFKLPAGNTTLNSIRALRLGFAARVGLGRSFTIGILSAEASVTVFGGLEGAAGYRDGQSLFNPTIYSLRGYMGLMVDISAKVDFPIIRATARILIYAEVGIEIRRVVASRNTAGTDLCLLTLPVVLFAEVGIDISVSVEIHVGCVSITIHLSFSAKWRFEERLGSLTPSPFPPAAALGASKAITAPQGTFVWNAAYQYWTGLRAITVYATVLPCLAAAADVGETGDPKTGAVGTMLLPVRPQKNAFGDLARFLVGWVLLSPDQVTGNPDDYAKYPITLKSVTDRREQMKDDKSFWDGFPAALLTVVGRQFSPTLNTLTKRQDEPLAVIPLWPGSTFEFVPDDRAHARAGVQSVVLEGRIATATPMSGADAAFVEYCQHFIASTLPEIQLLIEGSAEPRNDPARSLLWSDIWTKMFQL
jgi:hypothetical protein